MAVTEAFHASHTAQCIAVMAESIFIGVLSVLISLTTTNVANYPGIFTILFALVVYLLVYVLPSFQILICSVYRRQYLGHATGPCL